MCGLYKEVSEVMGESGRTREEKEWVRLLGSEEVNMMDSENEIVFES